MTSLRAFATLSSAVFLPLFFVELTSVAGFKLELNFIAAFIGCILFIASLRDILRISSVILVLITPFASILILFVASFVFVGERVSVGPFLAQIIFLVGVLGIGYTLGDWLAKNRNKLLLSFAAIVSISFVVALFMTTPTGVITDMIQDIAGLRTSNLVANARQAFNPESFKAGAQLETLPNNHNRIAQQVFSFAYIIAIVAFLAQPKASLLKASKVPLTAFALLLFACSLLLLSGQVLSQLLLTVMVVCIALSILRPVITAWIVVPSIIGVVIVALAGIFSSEYGHHWRSRLGSNNVSTGRVDRWTHFMRDYDPITVLGDPRSLDLDPHNMVVTLYYELGPLSLIAVALLYCGLLWDFFCRNRKGYREFGIGYIAAKATGPQLVWVTLIAGGYGFPGWAELSKISLYMMVETAIQNRRRKYALLTSENETA